MSAYINGIGAISIQSTLDRDWFTSTPISYHTPYVRCIEPDFNSYMTPLEARRMSRIIKRAVVSSKIALDESGLLIPDMIISGTGLGAVEDTEKFLTSMIKNNEQFLQPSFFIQSTHNSISSQIAIKIKCHGFNNTHVHRGVSFESALEEGLMLLNLKEGRSVLVGGYDELTPDYFKMLGKLNYWRRELKDSLSITNSSGIGTFSGEGSISFIISEEKRYNTYCEIVDAGLYYCPNSLQTTIDNFLERNGTDREHVDMFMTGKNGDFDNDLVYSNLYPLNKSAVFKNVGGEFFTSASFGLLCAASILKTGFAPSWYMENGVALNDVKSILIHNHAFNKNNSLILLKRC